MNPLLIGPLFGVVQQLLSGLGLDPEAKARAQSQAFALLSEGDFAAKAGQALALAQIDVNQAEATAGGFRGGWRPAIGWIGAVGLGYQWIAVPLGAFGYTLATGHALPVQPPALDPNLLWLMGSMLGVNIGARTLEKLKA